MDPYSPVVLRQVIGGTGREADDRFAVVAESPLLAVTGYVFLATHPLTAAEASAFLREQGVSSGSITGLLTEARTAFRTHL